MKGLLFVLVFLLLAGCTTSKPTTSDENSIKLTPTEFTTREKTLLEGLIGQEVMGYDLSSIPINHTVHLIVEHYHEGAKQENVIETATSISKDEKLTSILFSRESTDKEFTIKALTVNENGFSTYVANQEYKKAPKASLFKKLEEQVTFKRNEDVIIGLSIEDDGDEIMTGTLQEKDPRFQEIIKMYQEVFVYKIYVSKD